MSLRALVRLNYVGLTQDPLGPMKAQQEFIMALKGSLVIIISIL